MWASWGLHRVRPPTAVVELAMPSSASGDELTVICPLVESPGRQDRALPDTAATLASVRMSRPAGAPTATPRLIDLTRKAD